MEGGWREKAPWGPIDGWGAAQTGACILRTPAGARQRPKCTPPKILLMEILTTQMSRDI